MESCVICGHVELCGPSFSSFGTLRALTALCSVVGHLNSSGFASVRFAVCGFYVEVDLIMLWVIVEY